MAVVQGRAPTTRLMVLEVNVPHDNPSPQWLWSTQGQGAGSPSLGLQDSRAPILPHNPHSPLTVANTYRPWVGQLLLPLVLLLLQMLLVPAVLLLLLLLELLPCLPPLLLLRVYSIPLALSCSKLRNDVIVRTFFGVASAVLFPCTVGFAVGLGGLIAT